MVQYSLPSPKVFEALGDATRLTMVQMLLERDRPITELAVPFQISLTATLKHVRVLERAGLATSKKVGRERVCRLNAAPLKEVSDWADQVRAMWNARLDSLERYLAKAEAEDN